MRTQSQITQPRVERGLTKLVIPNNNNNNNYVTFVYPGEGPNIYQDVFAGILKRNLRPATGEEMASLLYSVYCDERFTNEPESKEIKEIMIDDWLYIPNKNLWTPKGVYVVYDEKGVGRSENLEMGELEKILKNAKEVNGVIFSKDRKVRFAPKGTYKLGYNSSDKLSENGFVIASYGKQGAKKLAEISTKFPNKPHVYGLNIQEGHAPELRLSALVGCNGDRLDVGDILGDGRGGHAFGVLE